MGWNDDVITQFRQSKGTENHWSPKLIVMHTVGARSGQRHLAPVVGFRNDDGWRVVASKGGAPDNPAWFHNLLANPEIVVEALEDGEIVEIPVTAVRVPDHEWEAVYAEIAAEEPQFGDYLEKTTRRIPVFQLNR